MDANQKMIEERLNLFRKDGGAAYDAIKNNAFLFSIFCARYFCYDAPDSNFDPDEFVDSHYTDGANDGGIDALLSDLEGSGDIIAIQCKYYVGSKLQPRDLKDELNKIKETINSLRCGNYEGFNDQLRSAYADSIKDCSGNPPVRALFFVTTKLSKKQEEKYREICKKHSTDDISFTIYFAKDIIEKIKECEKESPYVPSDELILDRENNVLWYGNGKRAAIVNISGNSLQALFNRHHRNALGLNLRYHVDKGQQNRNVDEEIVSTLKTCPQDFWFRNNGILIVCDDFKIKGKKLSFTNFSIVNGGQTSHVLCESNVSAECYLQCKIVSPSASDVKEKEDFINRIARATNSQKPIKQSDLKANQPEQIELKRELKKYNICYISKGGDVPKDKTKKYKSYQIVKLDDVGNLSVAGVLLRPGSVRSEGKKMIYDDENYKYMFIDDVRVGYIADLIELTHAFKVFKKYVLTNGVDKGFSSEYCIPMVENGERHFIACLAFLAKIRANVFSYKDFDKKKKDMDSVRSLLKKKGKVERILRSNVSPQDRDDTLRNIYSIIAKSVFGYCAKFESDRAADRGDKFTPSNYLKGDSSFFGDILPKLYEAYTDENSRLKEFIDKVLY